LIPSICLTFADDVVEKEYVVSFGYVCACDSACDAVGFVFFPDDNAWQFSLQPIWQNQRAFEFDGSNLSILSEPMISLILSAAASAMVQSSFGGKQFCEST